MSGSDKENDRVQVIKLQLEQTRVKQAQLAQAYEREKDAQKKEDAKAHALMEQNPRGHVAMMKMEQEHRRLALELPRQLLQHEAHVYQELQTAQVAAQAKMPETGKMMIEMVGMARWSQIPLLVLGLWLAFSPIAFSAPDAAAYANGTLVGMLVVVFAVLIPMMMTMPGPDVPLGWSYNPASWQQRAPILALALFSFFLARYMTAFQLGHITSVWDPIFGDGTALVLDSDLSKSFPISDGGLGAFVYLVELLSGFMGDPRRWRTMPWMVALFGFMVIPLGVVSVVLIMLQPIIIGAWCTVCLLSALFMLIMIALSLDEVIAMLQFLLQTRRVGKSVWRAFWLGGDALGDNLTPQRPQTDHASQMFWGVTVPWNLLVTAVLGAWLMIAPDVFQTQGLAADSDHILGALVVTVAIVAFAEVTRAARFFNIALALAIIVLPWVFGGATLASSMNNLIIGVLIIALSISPGKIKNTYDNWNALIV